MHITLSKDSHLKVDLLNLDAITKNTLKLFFGSNLSDLANLTQINQHTDVVITDFERGLSDEIIDNITNKNQFGIILYSSDKKPNLESSRLEYLKKPINTKELKICIKNIYNRISTVQSSSVISHDKITKKSVKTQANFKRTKNSNSHLYSAINNKTKSDIQNSYRTHKYVGSNKDIDPNNQEEIKRIYLTPEKYLYHHLVQAKSMANKIDSDISIKTIFGQILYHHQLQKFYYNFDAHKIKYMQITPLFDNTKLTNIEIKARLIMNNPVNKDGNGMIWESAIFASKGRVPKHTQIHNIINMTAWPNYSKLQLFRYAIQISAAWSQHKLSLVDSAKQLNIPLKIHFHTLLCHERNKLC